MWNTLHSLERKEGDFYMTNQETYMFKKRVVITSPTDTYTNIGENGWTLEMRIPFSSLQFENKPIQKWRVGFFREYYVAPQVHRAISMNRNFSNPCFDCQFNDFLVLENIKGGTRRDLLPYVLGGTPLENGPLDYQWEELDFPLSTV